MAASSARIVGELDDPTPILILGLRRGAFHHGALGIARSAGRLGIPVHRIALERFAPAAFSRYSKGWTVLSGAASEEQVMRALAEQRKLIGRAVLVPIDDAASVFVDEYADELREQYLFPVQPHGLPEMLASKRAMYEMCLAHDIATPWSAFPTSEEELVGHTSEMSFPVVLKVIKAEDAPPNARPVTIAADADELLHAYRAMCRSDGSNVMLQEYIPGMPESVWMFNGYFDRDSQCKIGMTGKKLRQAPPYTGSTSLGVCVANDTVHDTTVRLMRALGYRGILDIGYRYDARDGKYKLLDVNPRIGGSFRLFVGGDGMDVLRALYLDLTGQQVPPTSGSEGRRWMVQPIDLASSIAYRMRRDITLAAWIRSFKGVREEAWFAFDDPLPFLVLWLRLLLDWLPRRLLRTATGR
jgi:predicted ATP-grasp superfamily ATP-dependent carboligase